MSMALLTDELDLQFVPRLVQAHLQLRADPNQTECLGQTTTAAFVDNDAGWAWANDLFEKHRDRIESGDWMPMVCTEGSPHFVAEAA